MTSSPTEFLTLGWAAVDWIEHYLVHGPGDVQGQPIDLDDEFAAFIIKAYRVDAHGDRKVRRAFLSRAKGRSKSGLAAMIACFEALGPCRFDHFAEPGETSGWGYEYEPGEPVGKPLAYVEILNVATEESQAGNTYDAIYYMLSPETCSPQLRAEYGRIDVGLTRTNLPDRRGFIEPVTSADTSKDGGKSTFIVADETHLWILGRLKRLHGVMTRNLLKRKIASGWMLETSTMYGAGEDSVAEGTHDYSKQARRDRTLLFDHRQADEAWNLTVRAERMEALRQAYGPAAEWMNLDAICDSWDDPQVTEEEFRRYWLNQPVTMIPEDPSIIPLAKWADCLDSAADPDGHIGSVVLAVDSDPDRTRTTIAVAGRRVLGPPLVELTSDEEGEVDNRPGVEWAGRRIIEICGRNNVAAVVIDRASAAGSLVAGLEDAGVPVVTTSSRQLASACGNFFDAVVETQAVTHLDDPLLLKALKAASTRPLGDAWAWNRKKPTADITPLTSVTLALWGLSTVRKDEFVAPQRLR